LKSADRCSLLRNTAYVLRLQGDATDARVQLEMLRRLPAFLRKDLAAAEAGAWLDLRIFRPVALPATIWHDQIHDHPGRTSPLWRRSGIDKPLFVHGRLPDRVIPTAIKNDRWYESFSARRRPPTRRAIPTAEIVGRVNDFGDWYQTRAPGSPRNRSPNNGPLMREAMPAMTRLANSTARFHKISARSR
jgi:hypothetical protein